MRSRAAAELFTRSASTQSRRFGRQQDRLAQARAQRHPRSRASPSIVAAARASKGQLSFHSHQGAKKTPRAPQPRAHRAHEGLEQSARAPMHKASVEGRDGARSQLKLFSARPQKRSRPASAMDIGSLTRAAEENSATAVVAWGPCSASEDDRCQEAAARRLLQLAADLADAHPRDGRFIPMEKLRPERRERAPCGRGRPRRAAARRLQPSARTRLPAHRAS